MRLADVRYAREHPLLHPDLDERGDKGRRQLHYFHVPQSALGKAHGRTQARTDERRTRRDLDVVAQFEILNERQRLRKRLDRIPLEDLYHRPHRAIVRIVPLLQSATHVAGHSPCWQWACRVTARRG